MAEQREADKKSKKEVRYGEGGDHCGVCTHFIEGAEDEATETGRCELVAGAIGEDMWCKLFKRRPRGTIAEQAEYEGEAG